MNGKCFVDAILTIFEKFTCATLSVFSSRRFIKYPYDYIWKINFSIKDEWNWSEIKTFNTIALITQFCIKNDHITENQIKDLIHFGVFGFLSTKSKLWTHLLLDNSKQLTKGIPISRTPAALIKQIIITSGYNIKFGVE